MMIRRHIFQNTMHHNYTYMKGGSDAHSSQWSSDTEYQKKKVQMANKQRAKFAAFRQPLKLPPIKHLQVSRVKFQSENMNRIRELKSQMTELQQKLTEVKEENKLLKRIEHQNTAALQYFLYSEDSITQILARHEKETRVLQRLLRDTRASRDALAKKLELTERELLCTKDKLHHLQQLNEDRNLLERETLTNRLAKATAELEKKDKRIQELERMLELREAAFNRQLTTEQKKVKEVTEIAIDLREEVSILNRKVESQEKELNIQNIYDFRLQRGTYRRGGKSKMIQTDEVIQKPTKDAALQCSDTEQSTTTVGEPVEEPEKEPEEEPAEEPVEEPAEEQVEEPSEEVLEEPVEELIPVAEPEAPPIVSVEETESETESDDDFTEFGELEESQETTEEPSEEPESHDLDLGMECGDKLKKFKTLKIRNGPRHIYTFTQVIENLHNGLPAFYVP
ncbi:uncharacterized protein ACB058_009822 isoform 1-T1 [Synchiropus picturatus]